MNAPALLTVANVVFSLKTFAAAMLAYWIALCFDLPKPFWAVGTVYIIAHPLSGAITSKAIYRLLGTLIGGVMTVVLVPNFVNAPVLLTGAVTLWVGFCVFISLLDRTPRSYVFLLAGYTVLLAGLPLVDTPAAAFETAVARVEEIGLAIICAALISRLVIPNHAGPVLVRRVDAWLADVARLTTDALNGRMNDAKVAGQWRRLAADAVDMRSFTTHVFYDTSHHRELTKLMRGLQQRKVALLPVVSALADIRSALTLLGTSRSSDALALFERVAVWIDEPLIAGLEVSKLRGGIRAIERSDESASTWENLVLHAAVTKLLELIDIWIDCQTLRSDISSGKPSPESQRIIAMASKPNQHADYGMALLSAFSAMTCVALATLFWIEAEWPDGMTVAQISGVFCCLLATMDDPVPAMRKFLPLILWAAGAAFVYNFAIMPAIDGFVPLAAALGIFLIPAGVCLAVPSRFLIGMGLCVNFPFMLGLGARLSTDFVTFINGNIATVLAVTWAMVVCSLIKSIGAETSGRRLMRNAFRQVHEMLVSPRIDTDLIRNRMLDTLGLLAPRAAAVSAGSDIATGDLVRDLRMAVELARLRDLSGRLPKTRNMQIQILLAEAMRFYRMKSSGKNPDPALFIKAVGRCLSGLSREADSPARRDACASLAAIHLCLLPNALPPSFISHLSPTHTLSIVA